VTLGADVGSYYYSAAELEKCVEGVEWPNFVTNTRFEIIAANRFTRRLWGIDSVPVEHIDGEPRGRNIIALGLERGFASRICNWDELVVALAAQIKGRPGERTLLDEAEEYLREVLPALQAADERVQEGMLRAWMLAHPVPPKIRWTYDVHWLGTDGRAIGFNCFAALANDVEGLEFHDWIPRDEASWCAIASGEGM
jgi:hypothetical protein